jgi:hypothetical protein
MCSFIVYLDISLTAGSDGAYLPKLELRERKPRILLSLRYGQQVLLLLARVPTQPGLLSPPLPYSIASGSPCRELLMYHFTVYSVTLSVDRSPTSSEEYGESGLYEYSVGT